MMNYGYPGSNSQIENHNVSEESFWPSFTDIMMVIVMVFLLVTVSVILNNWALITKLTSSVEAQKAATTLAENRQEKNLNHENKLSTIQQNLLALNEQFEKEKKELVATEANLKKAAATLTAKEQSLASIENKLSALNEKYESDHQKLENTSQKLTASEKLLSNTDQKLLSLTQQLTNKETIIASLDKKYQDATALIAETQTSLEVEKKKLEINNKKLSTSEDQLANTTKKLLSAEALNKEIQANFEAEKKKNEEINLQLTANEKKLTDANNKLQKAETLIAETKTNLDAEVEKLVGTNTKLTQIEEAYEKLEKEKQSLVSVSSNQKQEITEKSQAVDALQSNRKELDEQLQKLLVSVKSAEETIETNKKSHAQIEAELLEKLSLLQTKNEDQNTVIADNKVTQTNLESELAKKSEQVASFQQVAKADTSIEDVRVKLTEALKLNEDKDNTIKELTVAQESGHSQLRSLQGEYDTLDSKYQKLLRPARSSKGKFIATVTYKKSGGKKVIRYKPSPNSSYRTVSSRELAKSLESLKKKHKDDLYLKVIIPQNSGLSYNEAWKFTINLQRKYDYYYNESE